MTRDLERGWAFLEQGNSFLVGRSAVLSKIWNLAVSKKQCSTRIPGEMIQFDYCNFSQMGWNHQLEIMVRPPPQKKPLEIFFCQSNPVGSRRYRLSDGWCFYVFILWCFRVRCNARIFQHTPGTYPRPPTNGLCFGIPFIWGFRDSWGMLQGYVGVFLDY